MACSCSVVPHAKKLARVSIDFAQRSDPWIGQNLCMADEHGHTPDEVAERLSKRNDRNHLKDMVYGGIDGAVTTFAIVAGVEGAGLSPSVIIALGIANILADGFSMAAGNFAGRPAIGCPFPGSGPEGRRNALRPVRSRPFGLHHHGARTGPPARPDA